MFFLFVGDMWNECLSAAPSMGSGEGSTCGKHAGKVPCVQSCRHNMQIRRHSSAEGYKAVQPEETLLRLVLLCSLHHGRR